MKRLKDVLAALVVISFLMFALGRLSYAQPTEEQLNALRSVKTMRIIVEESYGEAKDVSLQSDFEDVTRRVLGCFKVKVVGANVKDYDATLKIEVKGTASGATYSFSHFAFLPGVEGTFYYTGADLSGWIEWEIPDDPNFGYKKSFEGEVHTPERIEGPGFITPSGAPFHTALQNSTFVVILLETIEIVYGLSPFINVFLKDVDFSVRGAAVKVLEKIKDPRAVETLIAALKDVDYYVRQTATWALGEIKDPRAVEPLIAVLKDKNSTRFYPALALKKITGENFGEDPAKWQEWWEENKGKFGK